MFFYYMVEPTDKNYECVRNCACDGSPVREESFTRRGSFTEVMYSSPSFKVNEKLHKELEKLRMENEKLYKENEKLKSKCFWCFNK